MSSPPAPACVPPASPARPALFRPPSALSKRASTEVPSPSTGDAAAAFELVKQISRRATMDHSTQQHMQAKDGQGTTTNAGSSSLPSSPVLTPSPDCGSPFRRPAGPPPPARAPPPLSAGRARSSTEVGSASPPIALSRASLPLLGSVHEDEPPSGRSVVSDRDSSPPPPPPPPMQPAAAPLQPMSVAFPSSGPPPANSLAITAAVAAATAAAEASHAAEVAASKAALSSLESRFDAETLRRSQLEDQLAAMSRQIDTERVQHAETSDALKDAQALLKMNANSLAEYAAMQAKLRSQVAELSGEKAMLASQIMDLEEKIEELSAPPPPPPTAAVATPAEPVQGNTSQATQNASAAAAAAEIATLQTRCAQLDRLWRTADAERESLQLALDARNLPLDETASDADAERIRSLRFHGSDGGFDTVVASRSHYSMGSPVSPSGGLFVHTDPPADALPPPPPPPAEATQVDASNTESARSRRNIPADLDGFDSDSTIRLKPGAAPPQHHGTASASHAHAAAAAAAAHAYMSPTAAAQLQAASPPHLAHPPLLHSASHPPATRYGVPLPTAAPSSAASPAAASSGLTANPALPAHSPASAGSTITITELDASKIAAAWAAKYHWVSPLHIQWWRNEVEELMEDEGGRDEDALRWELRNMELRFIAPLEFELVEKIGAGGFGAVYRAVSKPRGFADRTHVAASSAATGALSPSSPAALAGGVPAGEHVAIKIINLDETDDDISTITREITAITAGNSCAQLTHYHTSMVLGTKLWVVMELVDGGSVLDFIKRKRLQQEQLALRSILPGMPLAGDQRRASLLHQGSQGSSSGSISVAAASATLGHASLALEEKYISIILREVLWALLFLESRRTFHRDVKAANILLSKSTGEVKLADLGASTQLTDTMTKANTLIGSPYWMAPEIMMQEKYDGKAGPLIELRHIWSLGITCIEMATGAPPHFGIHPVQVMTLITNSPPPVLEGDAFSKGFKEFVALCLVKDPNRRPTLTQLLKHAFIKKAKKTSEIKVMIKEAFRGK